MTGGSSSASTGSTYHSSMTTTTTTSDYPMDTSSTNMTLLGNSTTETGNDNGLSQDTRIAIGVVAVIVVCVLFVIAGFFILKKLGKLPIFFYHSIRKRRSSTSSSRRALDDDVIDDNASHRPNEKLKQTTEEMFTIEEFEEPVDRERDEYYYDEVFGQSEFEDERTQNSVSQLYSRNDGTTEPPDEDEMLDFDFETLGIKMDGYNSVDAGRKVTI